MIADIADGSGCGRGDRRQARRQLGRPARSPTSATRARSRRWSRKTIERFGKIDMLVNNAALYAPLQETKCTEIDVDAVGQGDGGQPARAVPDGEARGAAHDARRATARSSISAPAPPIRGIPLDAALRHHQGRHHGDDAGAWRASSASTASASTRWRRASRSATRVIERESRSRADRPRPRRRSRRSLQRDEHPQDLLGALVFLASADSDFVTGQTIAVDGGNVNT